MYSVSQKSSPPKKLLRDNFICGEPEWLKIISVIAKTYSYAYTNFRPFIWIFVWIVSLLLVRPLNC